MSGGEIPKGLQLLVHLCYKLWEGKNEEEELLAQAAMFSTLAKIDIGCFRNIRCLEVVEIGV